MNYLKKSALIIVLVQISSVLLIAQGKSAQIKEFKTRNREIVSFYRKGKLKSAQKSAQAALDLALKIFGKDHRETAISYKNLGEIYRARKKYGNSIENLEASLVVFRKNPSNSAKDIAEVLKSLGTVLALSGKAKKAESVFEESIEFAAREYGKKSEEFLAFLKTQTYFYIYTKDFGKVDQLFVKRYAATIRSLGMSIDRLDEIEDEYNCYCTQNFSFWKASKKFMKFRESISELLASTGAISDENDTITGFIINGKALYLPKPAYPFRARDARVKGVVTVKIKIGVDGNVVSAEAICGPLMLRKTSEKAARKARFRPTTIDGRPVKVKGTIMYSFN